MKRVRDAMYYLPQGEVKEESFGRRADISYERRREMRIGNEIKGLEEFLYYDNADPGEWCRAYERLEKVFPVSDVFTGLMKFKYKLIKMAEPNE